MKKRRPFLLLEKGVVRVQPLPHEGASRVKHGACGIKKENTAFAKRPEGGLAPCYSAES